MNTTRHPFDIAIDLTGDAGRYGGRTTAAYANMIGPYGGITAAVLLKAVWNHPQRVGEPVSLTVNFLSAIAEGDFDIEARPVRTNRSTQYWYIELLQKGEVMSSATAIFAIRRETWEATEILFPTVPAADQVEVFTRPGLPAWTGSYEFRFLQGDTKPSSTSGLSSDDSVSLQWVRDQPPRPLDFMSLASICDVFFPRIFVKRKRFVPIGTVSLTIYFHADSTALSAQGERPVLGQARALRFHAGYFDQTAEIWSESGGLLATTTQLVYFKE